MHDIHKEEQPKNENELEQGNWAIVTHDDVKNDNLTYAEAVTILERVMIENPALGKEATIVTNDVARRLLDGKKKKELQ